jgi:hypothetical protein
MYLYKKRPESIHYSICFFSIDLKIILFFYFSKRRRYFMKINRTIFLILGITLFLFLSTITVSAETKTDPQGDVWHYVYPFYQSQTVTDQPNSDIKEIKAETSGSQITLSMTLWPGGTFSRGSYGYASYIMYYNTSDAWYTLTYGDITGEEVGGMAMGYSLGSYNPPFTSAEVTVNGNTISATLDKVGDDTTTTELYGLAWIWEGYGTEQYDLDHWHDWVGDYDWTPTLDPDDEEPDGDDGDGQDGEGGNGQNGDGSTGDGNGGGDGKSPGFEIISLIIGITILIFVYRRKK